MVQLTSLLIAVSVLASASAIPITEQYASRRLGQLSARSVETEPDVVKWHPGFAMSEDEPTKAELEGRAVKHPAFAMSEEEPTKAELEGRAVKHPGFAMSEDEPTKAELE
ncbi:hypothetical protein DFH08DRAFT_73612 [Mycena albidolilacea]|uniref:Uncharacterized protein n=1 Tax=Mycena albidolilacea TaxID=1033008 RepID=A0AAD6YZT8_9AGAR|nr:hypothetical protein DFH08DRAFT_73612 [Mycena albidolilacea]